jgi:hypothetical protein
MGHLVTTSGGVGGLILRQQWYCQQITWRKIKKYFLDYSTDNDAAPSRK